MAALARAKPGDPLVAERFELYVCGVELANAFGELTDAVVQRARLEADMAEKRSDYFAAGTLVVWDLDPVAELIHVYRAADPSQPATYRRGQVAEAEPAALGWRVAVDWIFS